MIFALLLIFTSCSPDDDYRTVKGKVVRELTGEGVPNQKIFVSTNQVHGTGEWAYNTEIETKEVLTDANGNFSVSLKTGSNAYIYAFKPLDENYTEFQDSYFMEEPVVLTVNRYNKFKVFVKNANPFDANDFVSINFFSDSPYDLRTGIENFGSINTHFPANNITGPTEDASWHGTNVNSVVYYNVPENATSHKLIYQIDKNGSHIYTFTGEIPVQPGTVTEYHFDY